MKKQTIAIIHARGGSKRIPRKNVKEFCGKPAIAYPIEVALKSQIFDRVIVSTDDDEIMEVSSKYGAEIPYRRPAAFADDKTPTDTVLMNDIVTLKKDCELENICCIYGTSVFLQSRYLIDSQQKLLKESYDSIVSVTDFDYHPLRGLTQDENGNVSMMFPEHHYTRSQDLPRMFHDAAQFYFVKADNFLKEAKVFSQNMGVYDILPYMVADIDTPEDWRRAEMLYKIMLDNGEVE